MTAADETPVPDLNIGLERLCYIIVKAREFDAKSSRWTRTPVPIPAMTACASCWKTTATIRPWPS